MIGAIYDRDFFCQEEIAQVSEALSKHLALAHVHERKEIENYLLVPEALDRAIERAVLDRTARTGVPFPAIPKGIEILKEISDPLKDEVQSQIIARRTNFLRGTGKDIADITRETLAWFSPRWDDFNLRLTLLPGKEVLRTFRERIQRTMGVSLTDARIVEAMHKDEIPGDLVRLLTDLEIYRKAVNRSAQQGHEPDA